MVEVCRIENTLAKLLTADKPGLFEFLQILTEIEMFTDMTKSFRFQTVAFWNIIKSPCQKYQPTSIKFGKLTV